LSPPGLDFGPRVVAPPTMMGLALAPAPQGLAPPPVGPASLVQGQPVIVESWSADRLVEWLTLSGLGHLSRNFEEHRITGDILLELTSKDLDEIGVHAVGDKKRFLRATSELRSAQLQPAPPPPQPYVCPSPLTFTSNHIRPCPPQLDAYQSPFSSPAPDLVSNFPGW
jgi:hypothetical protein